MHTHFGSATHLAATFLGVLLVGTLWRLLGMHALISSSRTLQGIGKAMLTQY
jgi:hypothetical protein